jgi:hypothetical protein
MLNGGNFCIDRTVVVARRTFKNAMLLNTMLVVSSDSSLAVAV